MNLIRTAEDMVRALTSPLDPDLKALLQEQADRLDTYQEYDLSELAQFLIIQQGDTLEEIDAALGWALLEGGSFAKPVELIARRGGWIEVVFILSDDGFGLVLLVQKEEGIDPDLLALCQRHLQQHGSTD